MKVIGTTGQAPDETVLIETLADVERLALGPGEQWGHPDADHAQPG